jgi:DNA-binding LytR/AlgR family response regulator
MNTLMNAIKTGPTVPAPSSSEEINDAFVDCDAQNSCPSAVLARDFGVQTAGSTEIFRDPRALAKPQSLRIAIKASGKIIFINLGDVIAVQAKGKCVLLQQNGNSYLLRESISVVAERFETVGFIRIHRSVLVNTSFVEEIRPLSTGEYSLRVEGGIEYTVTRTYKKNLQSLAEFWLGTGAFFPD